MGTHLKNTDENARDLVLDWCSNAYLSGNAPTYYSKYGLPVPSDVFCSILLGFIRENVPGFNISKHQNHWVIVSRSFIVPILNHLYGWRVNEKWHVCYIGYKSLRSQLWEILYDRP